MGAIFEGFCVMLFICIAPLFLLKIPIKIIDGIIREIQWDIKMLKEPRKKE